MSDTGIDDFFNKVFFHIHFLEMYFSCVLFYYFLRIVCLFVSCVRACVCVCVKVQDASCPSLAVSVLSSSVEPLSQSLTVSVSFLNVRFDRASYPFSIAQISSIELSSA